MIGNLVVLLIIGIIVGIIFLNKHPGDQQSSRRKYLLDLAQFLGGEIGHLEHYENAYRIKFPYSGREFIYEDIRDSGFEDRVYSKAFLRTKVNMDYSLTFVEVKRSSLMAKNNSTAGVSVPEPLESFDIFTNKADKTNELLADETVLGLFSKFKNIDTRGHPVMSFEIREGELVLTFHSPGENLKPNLLDIQYNVPAIEDYLKRMMIIVNKLEAMKD